MKALLLVAAALLVAGCKHKPPRPTGPVEWTAEPLPAKGNVEINALGGTSASDVWAVGFGIFHFDGSTWSDAAPVRGAGTAFNAISVVARDDVWAVGVNGRVAHYDGKAWSVEQIEVARVSTDPAIKGYYDLLAVAAWPGEVWVTASRDALFIPNTMTPEPNAASFLNPAMWMLAKVQLLFGLSFAALFQWWRIAAALVIGPALAGSQPG